MRAMVQKTRKSRLGVVWKSLKSRRRKALISFITAGDPSLAVTRQLVRVLEASGADLIELGVPFSDPMADGPVIQRASERALKKGTTLRKVLALVRGIRRESQIPLVLMGYYNPIHAYGLKSFAHDAAQAGVDAVLVVDLPPEESRELDQELRRQKIALIYLLTPTSGPDRIRLVARKARGFVYFVSMTGITGGRLQVENEVRRKVLAIRRQTKLPVVVGFGISRPDQARRMARFADGVVVGSVLVSLIEKKRSAVSVVAAVGRLVGRLRSAIDG